MVGPFLSYGSLQIYPYGAAKRNQQVVDKHRLAKGGGTLSARKKTLAINHDSGS